MMRNRLFGVFLLLSVTPVASETIVPAKTIRPNSIITAQDIVVSEYTVPGSFSEISEVVGMEARVVLYPGQPIMKDNISEPAIVSRNQVVKLVYKSELLEISTTGRALDRGAVGEQIRIMNLDSRMTLVGEVMHNGSVVVTGAQF